MKQSSLKSILSPTVSAKQTPFMKQRIVNNQSVTDVKRTKFQAGSNNNNQHNPTTINDDKILNKTKQVDKTLIKGLSLAWRDKIDQWTPRHLQIMAILGFNLLAMQEDLVGIL